MSASCGCEPACSVSAGAMLYLPCDTCLIAQFHIVGIPSGICLVALRSMYCSVSVSVAVIRVASAERNTASGESDITHACSRKGSHLHYGSSESGKGLRWVPM